MGTGCLGVGRRADDRNRCSWFAVVQRQGQGPGVSLSCPGGAAGSDSAPGMLGCPPVLFPCWGLWIDGHSHWPPCHSWPRQLTSQSSWCECGVETDDNNPHVSLYTVQLPLRRGRRATAHVDVNRLGQAHASGLSASSGPALSSPPRPAQPSRATLGCSSLKDELGRHTPGAHDLAVIRRPHAALWLPVLAPPGCTWLSSSANPCKLGLASREPLRGGALGLGGWGGSLCSLRPG